MGKGGSFKGKKCLGGGQGMGMTYRKGKGKEGGAPGISPVFPAVPV